MKDRLKDKINTVSEEKRFSKRYVMLTLMIIAFFVTIIMVYYNLLYNEKRTNIIKSGEMAANNSADQLDKYLSTNIDSLKLTAYTLDGMLDENKSDEEIQDFLVGQSTAIRSAVIENSTGLYGYINGRFFSGTNWEPPEDYVATVRPWYLKPLENPGQITILDPYVDVQSGNTMLALGKTLKDGVSVVSVDVSLDQVQKLMEDAVASGDSDIEMILNDKGVVVAHSDRSEVGKDYNTEYDTLGSNILSQLHGNNTDSFEIHFQGSHYIVYVAEIRNSWRCISINDATSVFSSLSLLLAVTIAVVIAVVVIISIIMARSNRRRLIAEHLSTQLSSTSDIYISMHEIDFLKDTFSEVRNSKAGAIEMIGKNRNNCQQTIRTVMDHFCDPISKNDLLDFVDFSKLDNRLKDSNTITMEFLSAEKQWRRARFIVSGRLPDGRVSRAMYLVEDIDEERRRREKSLEEINILNTRISSIANIYMTAHELDVATDTFSEMKTDSRNISDLIGRTRKDAQGTLNRVMETVCDESCIDDVMRFIDLSTLQERLKYVDTIIIEYMNKDKVWRRGRFVVSGRDETGSLTRVLWLTEDIDNEKKERDMIIEMSERAIAANQAKSSFLSNMSHEIRTPINAVLGMNEMILRECDDKTILAYSDSIRTAGHTLLELVNDILDFSKIEAGKMEIIPAEYALSSMLNDLVNLIQPRADEKLLSLILDFDKDIPGKLFGDEVRIKQIITNILTNAVKYTEKGSVVFTLRYEKDEAEPDYIYLKVSVKDTGIGIKKENMDRLFSEFERIEEDKNRHVEGTGLGMSITRTLLNMMDSSLDVDSVYGLGSKFSFRLRQRVIDWEPLGDYETAYRQTLKELGKYKESFSAPASDSAV
ncbi:MAG: hypothetical protein J5842_02755 [Lachnospiraceae bacterium]|nr:hypothetical protein [Lachnospiraceae bacterium]